MNITFDRNELTNNSQARQTLITVMSDAKHGGFMRIHGFKSKTGFGEIQNTTYQKGIDYGTAVDRSLKMLETIEADPSFNMTITRGIWTDANGNENPTARQSKVFNTSKTITETYDKSSPVMTEALEKVRKSLTAPEAPTKEYEKLGNGVYQDESGTLFVRDLRLIQKTVVVHGNYPFKASKPEVALADAIKRDMPVSKYRMFRMDGEFDKVTLGGIEIAPEKTEATEIETEA